MVWFLLFVSSFECYIRLWVAICLAIAVLHLPTIWTLLPLLWLNLSRRVRQLYIIPVYGCCTIIYWVSFYAPASVEWHSRMELCNLYILRASASVQVYVLPNLTQNCIQPLTTTWYVCILYIIYCFICVSYVLTNVALLTSYCLVALAIYPFH